MSGGVIIYGDPHGEWRQLLRACEEERPDGVVIPGDCDLALPLRPQIKPVFDADIRVRWIPGNQDACKSAPNRDPGLIAVKALIQLKKYVVWWGPDRRRPGLHLERISSLYIKVLLSL